jgi:hypothetical protein
MDGGALVGNYLLYVVLPVWIAAGLADWGCHYASRIESTSGARESLLHLLMLAEAGIAVLAGLFLAINALVLALMLALFLLHELTAYWDLRYAAPRRDVTPLEQRVHDYLGNMPFVALSMVVLLHWPQFLALFGLGDAAPDFALRLKEPPLSARYVAALLVAIALFNGLPYLLELRRGLRAGCAPREAG